MRKSIIMAQDREEGTEIKGLKISHSIKHLEVWMGEEDTRGGGASGLTGMEGAVEDKLANGTTGICIQGTLEKADGVRKAKRS